MARPRKPGKRGHKGWGKPMAPAAAAQTVKLKKSVLDKVRSLNAEGNLVAELRLAAVARPLAQIEEADALEVLQGLVEQEEPIDDPTSWVCAAAKAILEGVAPEEEEAEEQGEEEGEGEGEEEGPEEEQQPEEAAGPSAGKGPAAKPPRAAPPQKVTLPASTIERVKQLNQSGSLQVELPLSEIAHSLAKISKEFQDQILSSLEAHAEEVNNPIGWVIRACEKKAGKGKGEAGKGKGKAAEAGKGKGKGKGKTATRALALMAAPAEKPLTASEKKIARTIKYLNHFGEFPNPVSYRHVKPSLDLVDEKTQLKILCKVRVKLEEGHNFANPSDWIKKACVGSAERHANHVKERNEQKRRAQAQGEWEEPRASKRKKAGTAAAAEGEEEWPQAGEEDEEEWE